MAHSQEGRYAGGESVILVLDDSKTRTERVLYEPFQPERELSLAERIQLCQKLKHTLER
ncbi:MAG: hypothetical protein OXN89_10670 [Bryobacterales bacterium]|nr:hypothetical protein [Bryobacterales bacterium]